MGEPTVAPRGSWRSPISAGMLATSAVWLSEVWVEDGVTYWLETRPTEGGRLVVVCGGPSTAPADVTPEGFNARTKVHEYGGGSYFVHQGTVFFSNFDDQRLYRQDVGALPIPITPEPPAPGSIRYADGRVVPDGRVAIAVRERHEDGGVFNELVAFLTDGSAEPRIVAGGRDFYSFPRISPDGRLLAWTCWDHPQMPWDGTELWVADLTEGGRVEGARLVAGSPSESIFQPGWSPDGILHFVSDRTGWWNLYRERDGETLALRPMEAEFGTPQWVFGLSLHAFLADGRIACIYWRNGESRLAMLDGATGEMLDLDLPYSSCRAETIAADGSRIAFVAGSATIPPQVVTLDFATRSVDVLRESERVVVDEGYLSVPQAIEFPTEGGLTAHALFYLPANRDFAAPQGEKPPLIVMSHGGPTSAVTAEFDLHKQFFTSRGFAVVDVNYGGSAGYGREYRDRLKGTWGVVDVMDCINAAKFLAARGEVDGERLAIRGGSAGGYTTLCALAFHDDFAAGASHFGLANIEDFATGGTHKFESRYLESLVGRYPEKADVYRARSPVHFADMISCPVILFQGLEDDVVPPAQAEIMVEALGAKGLPYAYLAFEGEQHGFRKAENIERTYGAELFFYAWVFGFELPDVVEPVEIHNLPSR